MHDNLIQIISFLKERGKYGHIIKQLNSRPLRSQYIFEAAFAYALESHNISLEYEVNVSPFNKSTVDFSYTSVENNKFCFELLSPEMSDEVKEEFTPRPTDIQGLSTFGGILSGDNPNPYFRPQALTIRLQEKIIEKVYKFPKPSDRVFSIIVADCSQFHSGHFDGEDCRMVMYGRTRNELLQEFWGGKPIKGLLDSTYIKKGADSFRQCVTAVIFVPKVDTNTCLNIIEKAFIVFNGLRSRYHFESCWQEIKRQGILSKLLYVPPPPSVR